MGKRRAKISPEPAAPDRPGTAPAGGEPEAWSVARLAQDLGVPAERVEQLQGLTCIAGEDVVDTAAGAVLTASGIKKIRERVAEDAAGQGAPDYPPDDSGEPLRCATFDPALQAAIPPAIRAKMDADRAAAEAARAAVHREDLQITRVFRWSCNVLATQANGNEVVLTVRSIAHLEAGMVLRGCIRGTMGWTYEGRLPRVLGERQLYFPPIPAAATKGKP
ncbi:MAG: hypothetical protein NDJ72_05220 [Elusimicrobia bacterium]|nr:hypothetical protein [Elusimicrobiota bacterium]